MTASPRLKSLSLAALLTLICGSAIGTSTLTHTFGAEGSLKVRIPIASKADATSQSTLVAEYESFIIVETAAASADALAKSIDGAEVLPGENIIRLNAGALDTATPAVKALQQPRGNFDGNALHLIQFAGPIQPAWYDQLTQTGVQIVGAFPSNSYLVYGDSKQLAALQAMAAAAPQVQWNGAFKDEYRIDPEVAALMKDPAKSDARDVMFAIQYVIDPASNPQTLALIDALKSGATVQSWDILHFHTVIAPLPPALLAQVAARPDVTSIQVQYPSAHMDERQDQIVAGNISGTSPSGPGYLNWLASRGFTQAQFTASGFSVDVSDSGIDNGTTTPNHFGLFVTGTRPGTSRIVYNRLVGTPNGGSTLQGCDGHGNLNTHIVLGYDSLGGFPFADAAGFRYGLGVCPFTKAGSSVIFDPSFFTSPDFPTLQSHAYSDGARISTNSWGNTGGNVYNAFAQSYDVLVRDAQPAGSPFPAAGNQEMVIVFANTNSGPAANTVHAPALAKNVISVGASENVQAFGAADGCGEDDTLADNINDIVPFSSRGPTGDGRKKPDLCAPGTHVSGGVAQTAAPAATGTANACFTASGVCGGPGGAMFFPAGQQFYTASSGTSHSCPAVAGGAALIRQFFINNGMAPPSPAMTKALLMNSARYMNGAGANDTLWSNNQGMGEMNLGDAFDRGPVVPTVLRDELAADTFTATGQTRSFTASVVDPTRPFRVTLAWTDAPGTPGGAVSLNNLNLTVTVGGITYLGNVFLGANSVSGGASDTLNNVESVFLPAGASGIYTVTVTAANIIADGVPNSGGALDQDFALVIFNGGVPVNNACASAIPYALGSSVTGYTVNATADGSATCGASSTTGDVWYSMAVGCPGGVRLDTCGSSYDTVLSVHSACPGTTVNQIACNDDNGFGGDGGCPGIRDSSFTFTAAASTTYLIRVSGFNGLTGKFQLNSSYVAGAADTCAAAATVADGAYTFTNCGALTDGPTEAGCPFCCGDLQVNGDLWFRYVSPVTGTVNVDTCASPTPFDTKIAIYSGGCPGSPNTAIACNDDAGPGCGASTLLSSTVFNSVANQAYLIRVGGYDGFRGTGVLTIASHAHCGSADFNCDGDIGTDADIAAFFACIAGTCPPPPCTSTADFNGDGDIGTDADIAAFFSVLGGGPC
jgi:hypothetical protein